MEVKYPAKYNRNKRNIYSVRTSNEYQVNKYIMEFKLTKLDITITLKIVKVKPSEMF